MSRSKSFWKSVNVSGMALTAQKIEKLIERLPTYVTSFKIRNLICPRKQEDPILTAKHSAKLNDNCPNLNTLVIENTLLTTYKSYIDFDVNCIPSTVTVVSLRGSIFQADFFFDHLHSDICIDVLDLSSCLCITDHHLSIFIRLYDLEELYLAECPIFDSSLMYLNCIDKYPKYSFFRLKVLDLEGTEMGDETIMLLQTILPFIEKLYLGHTKITDESFKYVDSLSLFELDTICLRNTAFTPTGLRWVLKLRSIEHIDITSSDILRRYVSGLNEDLQAKFRFHNEVINARYCDHFKKRNANV